MSFYKVTPDDLEFFTVVANPTREFSSSSSGITGSVNLFAKQSQIEKEVYPHPQFDETQFDAAVDLDEILAGAKRKALSSGNNNAEMDQYLTEVNNIILSERKNKQLNIFRFEPSVSLTKDSLKKNVVRKILQPFYRNVYSNANWAYTNYHTLNFFTSSQVPSDTAILLPNTASSADLSIASGVYTIPSGFTFEFYVNPRYTNDQEGVDFKAGTIFHLSSSYAVSLLSGSNKTSDGLAAGFRISLQLSHSADIIPSAADFGSYPNDLIFLSPDNSLKRNHWHHVAITWGTNTFNNGTGSFIIDGEEVSTFVIPSSSVAPAAFTGLNGNPDALVVGNYYDGDNAGINAQSIFFDNDVEVREGLEVMAPSFNQEGVPATFSFDHPLNAEVHELKIYNTIRTIEQIEETRKLGPSSTGSLLFYMPPFFTKESPFRSFQNGDGGVLQTPFFTIDSTTDDPFNVAMSFGVGGHYMNLENFGRDFATGNYARWYNLSASQISVTTEAKTANEFLYASGSTRKRNVTVLPCDNGLFSPDFSLLSSGSVSLTPSTGSVVSKFVDDFGVLDLSLITLNDMIPSSTLVQSITTESGSIFDEVVGATPENPGVDPGQVLTIFQRTRDNTSNEVVFFDISNLYYGNRINPESFKVTDSFITGTDKVSITLRDNGEGNLYRADSLTAHAKWNNVGDIYYNEGIAVVKSPNIPLFGTDQYDMTFEGESTVHVLSVTANADAGLINSSSNLNFRPISSSFNANEEDQSFVYISNVYYMDKNLNVLMKTSLAQPIKKKNVDKLQIRTKIDF